MNISPEDIKKILYETKILKREGTQRQSGVIMACVINLERVIKGVESEREKS